MPSVVRTTGSDSVVVFERKFLECGEVFVLDSVGCLLG